MSKQTIVLDFDGVLHPYTNGWQGSAATIAAEGPTDGAREAVAALRLRYRVVVYSTRCMHPSGVLAIKRWLHDYDIEVDGVASSKPPGVLYVDDRGFRFDGNWAEVFDFACSDGGKWLTPWHKRK